MGQDSTLKSLEGLVDSIHEINQRIKKIDWNKRINADYPETKDATDALKNTHNSESKSSLEKIFDESSLALSGLKRASE